MTLEQTLARLEEIVARARERAHRPRATRSRCSRKASGTCATRPERWREAEARVKRLTELADGAFDVEDLDD